MLFTPENAAKVMAGTKMQTRRIVKDEIFYCKQRGVIDSVLWFRLDGYHLKWQVGRTYAVQPGRGKSAIGRVKLLIIRKEKLQDISEEDARAEGCDVVHCDGLFHARQDFEALWGNINARPGKRWTDNPDVWVLTFERVAEATDG